MAVREAMNGKEWNRLALLGDDLSLCVNRIEEIINGTGCFDLAEELSELTNLLFELLVELTSIVIRKQ